MMARIASTLFLFFSVLFANAGIDFIDVDAFVTWEEMLSLAKNQHRNIFVQVVGEPCADCKSLKKSTFKSKEISNQVNKNFLALRVFTYSEVGRALSKLYGLSNQGTAIIVLNTDEMLFFKHIGMIDVSDLSKAILNAEMEISNYPKWQKGAVAGDLDKLDWISLLLIDLKNNKISPSTPIVRDVSTLLDSSDFSNQKVQDFISQLAISVDNPIFQTLKKNPSWISDGEYFNWSSYFSLVFDYNIKLAVDEQDSIFLEDVIFQLKQLPESNSIKNIELKSRQLYLAELRKWNAYDTITKSYLFPFPIDSVNLYQEEAMFLMENYTESKPSSLALEYLRLGLLKKETFELYYTLALYLYSKDDLVNAYKTAYRAWELSETKEDTALAGQLLRTIDQYY